MTVQLSEARRAGLIESLRGFYLEELDEELSAFRAEQLLDFFLDAAGPQLYNQAVQDARLWMQRKLDDLDVEVHVPDQALQARGGRHDTCADAGPIHPSEGKPPCTLVEAES